MTIYPVFMLEQSHAFIQVGYRGLGKDEAGMGYTITPGEAMLNELADRLQGSEGAWLDEVEVEGMVVAQDGNISIAAVLVACPEHKVFPPGVEVAEGRLWDHWSSAILHR